MILDGFAAEAAAISGLGLVFDETGATGNVFVEHLPQAPGLVVGIFSSGGPEGDSLEPYDVPSVQMQLRGADKDPRPILLVWYALYSHFHGLRNKTLPDGTYLVYSLATQSSPVRIGPDDNGRAQYSLNLRCEVRSSTEHRP
jgi:hypothetical protein